MTNEQRTRATTPSKSWMSLWIGVLLLAVAGPALGDARADARQHERQAYNAMILARYPDALREYRTAWELSQESKHLFNIALALHRLHQAAEAIEMYRNYVKLEPRGSKVAEALRSIAALEAEVEQARRQEAEARAQAARVEADRRLREEARRRAEAEAARLPLLEKQFERERLVLNEAQKEKSDDKRLFGLSIYSGPKAQRQWYRGGVALAPTEFFELVGRRDLAGQVHTRTPLRRGLFIGGSALGILGLLGGVLGGLSAAGSCQSSEWLRSACLGKDLAWPVLGASAGAAAIGTTLLVVAALLRTPDEAAPESIDLADQYNQKLRERIGLPSERPGPPRVGIAPSLGPHGGGLVVSLAF